MNLHFRAWFKEGKRMFYDIDSIRLDNNEIGICTPGGGFESEDWEYYSFKSEDWNNYDEVEVVLMQGFEINEGIIFEGDLIEYNGVIYETMYDNGMIIFINDTEILHVFDFDSDDDFKIVGNKFEGVNRNE